MDAKGTGMVGLAIVGVLIAIVGAYFTYKGFVGESFLIAMGGLIGLATGITMTAVGFKG